MRRVWAGPIRSVVAGAFDEDSAATGVDGNQGDNSALESGAAYVFTRNGTSWTQQAYLKASNTGIGNVFGYSVSISGDTLVIGAQNEASAGTGVNGSQTNGVLSTAGAASVFERKCGSTPRRMRCSPPPPAPRRR